MYDPGKECQVFLAVQELGEATLNEVHEYLNEQEQVELEKKLLLRYLRRWKAKKVFALNYVNGKAVWKLADIPPWYCSGIMALVKGTINEDMRTFIDAMDERIRNEGRIIKPTGKWGNYHSVEIIFETLDPILGGRDIEDDADLENPENLKIPVNGQGKRFAPPCWFKGWIRENAAIEELPKSVCYQIQYSPAELPDFTPMTSKQKVKVGMKTYEAIPPGIQFTSIWSIPFRGSHLDTLAAWKKYVKRLCYFPKRGIGANPYAMGGRLKLLAFQEIDLDERLASITDA